MAPSWLTDAVGAANIIMIFQILSGVFVCRDIFKEGSTANVPANLFVMGAAFTRLLYTYSSLVGEPTMVWFNWIGLLLSCSYVFCYWLYCTDRPSLYKLCRRAAMGSTVLVLYTRWVDPEVAQFHFGLIVSILMFALAGMPLLELPEIYRTQCSARIQRPIVMSGTAVGSMCILYSLLIGKTLLTIQHGILLTVNLFQIWLYTNFPRTPSEDVKKVTFMTSWEKLLASDETGKLSSDNTLTPEFKH